jgi:HNH endonuclease
VKRFIILAPEGNLLHQTDAPDEAVQVRRARQGIVAVVVTEGSIGPIGRIADFHDHTTIAAALRKTWRLERHRIDSRCDYCRLHTPLDHSTVDHIRPLADGGPDDESNWAYCCTTCNSRKGRMSVSDFRQLILSAPAFQALASVAG